MRSTCVYSALARVCVCVSLGVCVIGCVQYSQRVGGEALHVAKGFRTALSHVYTCFVCVCVLCVCAACVCWVCCVCVCVFVCAFQLGDIYPLHSQHSQLCSLGTH